MAFLVEITARAQRDLEFLFSRINAQESEAALKWYRGLKEAILSLEQHPDRCSAAPENPELRHLLYGRKPHVYRVIFRVLEKRNQVNVLHIRHGARSSFQGARVR